MSQESGGGVYDWLKGPGMRTVGETLDWLAKNESKDGAAKPDSVEK